MTNIIENADSFGIEQRILSASKSLNKWYKKKHSTLISEDCDLARQAAREDDIFEREKIDARRKAIESELNDLNIKMRSCELSSLENNIKKDKVTIASAAGIEKRVTITAKPTITAIDSELQREEEGRKKLNAVAAVYNQETNVANLFTEEVASGAFKYVIKDCDCRLLKNHDSNYLYSRTTNSSLRLYDSRQGLVFWGDLLPSPVSDELFEQIRTGLLSGCSFQFSVEDDDWRLPTERGGLPHRTIIKIGSLLDVSVCTYPQYEGTSCQAVMGRSEEQIHNDRVQQFYEEFDKEYPDFEHEQAQKRTFERKYEEGKKYRKCLRILARNTDWLEKNAKR